MRGENDVKFYEPTDARVVTEADELARANAGPDWTCGYCGGDNVALATVCKGCSGERESGNSRKEKFYSSGTEPRSGEDLRAPARREPPPRHSHEPIQKRGVPASLRALRKGMLYEPDGFRDGISLSRNDGRFPLKFKVAVALIVLSFFGLLYLGLAKHEEPLLVQAKVWERQIEVEAYRLFHEEDWDVPSGGTVTGSERRHRRTDKVEDGTETYTEQVRKQTGTNRVRTGSKDMGNGYFKDVYEDRPVYGMVDVQKTRKKYKYVKVYDNWHYYDIMRWVHARVETTRGVNDAPRWPEPALASNERNGPRKEEYNLTLRRETPKKPDEDVLAFRCPDQARWESFEVGERCVGIFNGFGSLMGVKHLNENEKE